MKRQPPERMVAAVFSAIISTGTLRFARHRRHQRRIANPHPFDPGYWHPSPPSDPRRRPRAMIRRGAMSHRLAGAKKRLQQGVISCKRLGGMLRIDSERHDPLPDVRAAVHQRRRQCGQHSIAAIWPRELANARWIYGRKYIEHDSARCVAVIARSLSHNLLPTKGRRFPLASAPTEMW
jgi:hypothetical protein